MIRAVLFDMGNTLVDVPSPYGVYDKILRTYGIILPLEVIERAHDRALKELSISRLAEFGKTFWRRFNLIVIRNLGITKDSLKLARTIDKEYWNFADVAVYSDVLPVLSELKKRRLKLGLVTNGLRSDIEPILKKTGLEGVFDAEVGTDTFNRMKPDKEVFLLTLKMISVTPRETLFVGDALETDYLGARNAGIRSLLIDRNNTIRDPKVETIRSLYELISYA